MAERRTPSGRSAKALVALSLTALLGVLLTPTDATAAGHSVGQHTVERGGKIPPTGYTTSHGKHGKFSFPDSASVKTGARCTYSGGKLTSVTVAAPVAAARSYWRRGQYVPWKAKLERKSGGAWKLIAVGSGGVTKPLQPGHVVARAPLTVKTGGKAPGRGIYRVVDKLSWIANLPGGPEEGFAKHSVAHYHVGFGRADRPYCQDFAPKVAPPSALSVIGSDTLTLDAPGLLANASQAQGDPLHAHLISAIEGGKPWLGAVVARDGRLTVPTKSADIGQTIVVSYQVVDAAGRKSLPVKVAIKVTNAAPVAANQSFGPATPGQALTIAAPGLLHGATGPGDTVTAVTSPSFNATTDAFTWTPDGGFAITPTLAEDNPGSLTFSYTVTDSAGKVSLPATATISVAPVATDHAYGPATPGQALTVGSPGLLSGASGPGLTVGPITNPSFDPTADALTVNADGSLSITPERSQDSTTLTFSYTVVNSANVSSAPQTVSISVGHLAPVGVNDTFTVARGTTLNGCVLTNDTFYGNPQTKTSTTPAHSWSSTTYAFVFSSSTGCFTMSPSTRRAATTLTFTYSPIDSVTGSTATATITVT